MSITQRLLPTLAAALVAGAGALPALADESRGFAGDAGVQLVTGQGPVVTVDFAVPLLQSLAVSADFKFAPSITDFFAGDAAMLFVGDTAAFLPISIKTTMGMGVGTFMHTVPASVSKSEFDFGAYLQMPLGVSYTLPFIGVTGSVGYTVPALYFFKTKQEASYWRFALSGEVAALRWRAYYDRGPVFDGPGASVGLNF